MSPRGRPEGEDRSAQHGGSQVSPHSCPAGKFRRSSAALAAALALVLSGCATYQEAGRYVAPGGKGDQEIADNKRNLERERAQNTALQDEKLQREREVKRMDDRLRAMRADLGRQDQALAALRRDRKLTEQRYSALKKEMDAVRSETQQLDLQHQGDLGAASSAETAAKQKRLQALEARKQALEASLAQVAK